MRASLGVLRGSFATMGLIGAVLACSPSVRAADDGYANVFSSVLSAVGVIKVDPGPEIEYRERPPLALPPATSLPKPVASGVKRTAAWPKDPDVARRRKASEEARAPLQPFGTERNEYLSKDDLMKGRAAAEDTTRPTECGVKRNGRGCLVVSPDELKAEGERYNAANPEKVETLQAGQEPDRVFLTQPPKGYMAASRTVKATTEAPDKKLDEANPRAFLMPEKKADE